MFCMQDLLDALQAAHPPVLQPDRAAKIIKARVPIIKCYLAAGARMDSSHMSQTVLYLVQVDALTRPLCSQGGAILH